MRARYSAYATRQVGFLADSLHPEYRSDLDLRATRRLAERAEWLNLQVLGVRDGGADDSVGEVEFVATYKEQGIIKSHRERAQFRRRDGLWYYVDGELVKPQTKVHQGPKVGRNDPCPCGSGKKYKRCCGH
jgi:SEC-C motif-containing protein